MLKRIALIILILTQLLYLAALVPWYIVAQLTYSSFDPVVANVETARWWFLYAVLGAPVIPLLFSLLGWIHFGRRRYWGAIIWMLLPVLVALPALAYLYPLLFRNF